MNAFVKSSSALRYAVLAAAGTVFLIFWLMRGNLPSARLPALSQLARHDNLRAEPVAQPVRTEIVLSAAAVAIPAKVETVAAPTAVAAAPAAASANLAPPAEVPPAIPATPATPAGGLSEEDRVFFEKAGQAGIQQDKVSRGVLNQLIYPEVREYVYVLLDEQAAINAELLLLAARKQVVVPEPDRVPFRRWGRGEGSIDQHYVDLLVDSDTEAVALYEKAAQSADPEISAYARKTLPLMQRRLTAVSALKKITD